MVDAVLRSRRTTDTPAPDLAADMAEDDGGGEDALAAERADSAQTDEAADEGVPAYLLELLQNHRNRQHLEDDFGYHDDYRERYDGFDTPPPFRQRHKQTAKKPAREVTASDLEISEEEAFSTRVFVTTPRRQR